MYSWLLLWNFPGKEESSGANHYFLNTLVPDSVYALSQILLTIPISHCVCLPLPTTTAFTQFPMVTEQVTKAALSPSTHTDQLDPDIGLTEKGSWALPGTQHELCLESWSDTTQKYRRSNASWNGLNEWEKISGSKWMYLPFPLSPWPPTSPCTIDGFKGAVRAYLASLKTSYEASQLSLLSIDGGQLSNTSPYISLLPLPCFPFSLLSIILSWDQILL